MGFSMVITARLMLEHEEVEVGLKSLNYRRWGKEMRLVRHQNRMDSAAHYKPVIIADSGAHLTTSELVVIGGL